MTIKKCSSNSNIQEQRAVDKIKGHQIALLEKKLQNLDHFERATKSQMLDRMKFMSGKNVRMKNTPSSYLNAPNANK